MKVYEKSMINIMNNYEKEPKICSKISLCSENDYLMLSLRNKRQRRGLNENTISKRCTWGNYMCDSDEIAKACNVIYKHLLIFCFFFL